MKDVVVIGAGKIRATIAGLLASTSDYQVILRPATCANGIFFEHAQTGRGLARADDSGWAVRARRFDQRRRCGRNT
jgi:saccharopine dehydrogenase-like NADP-dependent oxidoreductase